MKKFPNSNFEFPLEKAFGQKMSSNSANNETQIFVLRNIKIKNISQEPLKIFFFFNSVYCFITTCADIIFSRHHCHHQLTATSTLFLQTTEYQHPFHDQDADQHPRPLSLC